MGKYDRYLKDDTDPKDEVQIMIANELAEANRLRLFMARLELSKAGMSKETQNILKKNLEDRA